jgi:hypothetical protein
MTVILLPEAPASEASALMRSLVDYCYNGWKWGCVAETTTLIARSATMDPATGAIFGATAGSLTLVNALIKICEEHRRNPKADPPNVAEVIGALPAAGLRATDELVREITGLRQECRDVGIDLDKPLRELQTGTGLFERRRRRLLKTFMGRVDAIGAELSVLFDDVVAVCDCADRLNKVARSFELSRQEKEQLGAEISERLPLGTILTHLLNHAEKARVRLGDLNRP